MGMLSHNRHIPCIKTDPALAVHKELPGSVVSFHKLLLPDKYLPRNPPAYTYYN